MRRTGESNEARGLRVDFDDYRQGHDKYRARIDSDASPRTDSDTRLATAYRELRTNPHIDGKKDNR